MTSSVHSTTHMAWDATASLPQGAPPVIPRPSAAPLAQSALTTTTRPGVARRRKDAHMFATCNKATIQLALGFGWLRGDRGGIRAARRAGAELRERVTVDDLLVDNGRVTGLVAREVGARRFEERASLVVGVRSLFVGTIRARKQGGRAKTHPRPAREGGPRRPRPRREDRGPGAA